MQYYVPRFPVVDYVEDLHKVCVQEHAHAGLYTLTKSMLCIFLDHDHDGQSNFVFLNLFLMRFSLLCCLLLRLPFKLMLNFHLKCNFSEYKKELP